ADDFHNWSYLACQGPRVRDALGGNQATIRGTPYWAESIAARSFERSGFKSASRFVLASSTTSDRSRCEIPLTDRFRSTVTNTSKCSKAGARSSPLSSVGPAI